MKYILLHQKLSKAAPCFSVTLRVTGLLTLLTLLTIKSLANFETNTTKSRIQAQELSFDLESGYKSPFGDTPLDTPTETIQPWDTDLKLGGVNDWDRAQDIKLITWNIEWYPGGSSYASKSDANRQRKAVARVISELNPTILAAQEIRDWEAFKQVCSPIKDLQPLAVSYFPREPDGEYWPQQVAIGSKLKATAAWAESWKPSKSQNITPRRGFSVAALQLINSRSLILIYSIHLKSNRVEEGDRIENIYKMREESIRQLIAHANSLENNLFKSKVAGIIVTGDFNTNEDGNFKDKTLQLLREAGYYHTWQFTPKEQRYTWVGNSKHSKTCFDHVFTKYLGKPQTKTIDTPATRASSDHLPLETIIKKEDYMISIHILNFKNKIEEFKVWSQIKSKRAFRK